MAKKRVYEVAKQLNISNKDLIDKLKGIGVEVSNHMASIDDATIEKVTELLAPKKEEKKAEEKPAAPAEAKKAEQPKNNNNNNGNNNNSNRNQKNNQNNNRNQFVKNDQPKKNGQNGQNGNNQQNRNDNRNDNRSNGSNQRNDGQQKNNGSNANVNNGNNKNKNKNNNNNNNNNGFNNNRNNNNKNNKNNNNNNNNNKNNGKNKNNKQNQAPKPEPVAAPEEDEIRTMEIPETLTVKELAEKIGKSGAEIVKCLMKKGIMAAINQTVDFDTAVSVGEEYNVIFEPEVEKDIFEEAFKQEEEDESVLEPRPPVVVVMGHVDHGKTSLLDAIRHSHVTSREAGGITQHIGAYTVEINGSPITFLDTPGHEAFTAMRLRGAMITDIAVLVVAADDGVMPHTIEAINHAKAAGVEVIVAINKIDKPSANPDRVKQELVEYGLVAEDWGGETICVPVSAQTKEGIDTLLEMIILTAEMKELKANPNKPARGAIIEAQLDKGRGPVATVLVQEGTLNVGDPIVAGAAYGKIRAMMDDKGRRVKKAGPSKPVEILGLSEVPAAGETFYVAANEKQARQLAESVIAKSRKDMLKDTPQKVSLDDLFNQIQSGNVKELNIVVKADVQGSVEAVKQSLEKLSNDEVRIRIIHGGVGAITESDVMLATASNAIIIGFNVRPEPSAKAFADEEKVDVRLYSRYEGYA